MVNNDNHPSWHPTLGYIPSSPCNQAKSAVVIPDSLFMMEPVHHFSLWFMACKTGFLFKSFSQHKNHNDIVSGQGVQMEKGPSHENTLV